MTALKVLKLPPERPNTHPLFNTYDNSKPLILNLPSLLYALAWVRLLITYPGDLKMLLPAIIIFGAQIGYIGPLAYSYSLNYPINNPAVIIDKLRSDLLAKWV